MYLSARSRMAFDVQHWLPLILLAVANLGLAEDFRLESAGGRFGYAASDGASDFHQAEAFADWKLPWGLDLGRQFALGTRLDLSGGWLGDSHKSAFLATVGPTLVLSKGRFPVSIEGGLSPTFISRYNFPSRDFGSVCQFTSHAGVNIDLFSWLRLGYRFQHMSNGGLSHPNPGLNLHVFGVSYLF